MCLHLYAGDIRIWICGYGSLLEVQQDLSRWPRYIMNHEWLLYLSLKSMCVYEVKGLCRVTLIGTSYRCMYL